MTQTLERGAQPRSSWIDTSAQLLPFGTMHIHTNTPDRSAALGEPPDNVQKRVTNMNTRERIIDRFFTFHKRDPDGSQLLSSFETNDGGKLTFIKPTSRYGEFDMLINAIPKNFQIRNHPDGSVRPYHWLDLGRYTRRAMSDASIVLLRELQRTAKPNQKAFYMHNFGQELQPKTGQTQSHVHGHVVRINQDAIVPYNETGDSPTETIIINNAIPDQTANAIRRGHEILQHKALLHDAKNRLETKIASYSEKTGVKFDGLDIRLRTSPPYGFSFTFNGSNEITLDNVTAQANLKKIFNLRDAIASSYSPIARVYESMAKRVPNLLDTYTQSHDPLVKQPSYQEITHFRPDGKFEIIVVPTTNKLGPVENLGVTLIRKNDDSLKPNKDTMDEYYRLGDITHEHTKGLNFFTRIARYRPT